MPKTLFSPAKHGFHFANYFENVILEDSPFGRIATRGRCGGMAFTALDHFHAGLPLPNFTQEQLRPAYVPPDAHPLSKYIYKRQLDSFFMLSAVKYITWSLSPDDAGFFVKGVARWTREDEFPKLRANIDAGKPVTLGLIAARDLAGLQQNHQVVAYGYDTASKKDGIIVHVYDVNAPDKELTLSSDKSRNSWITNSANQESWRGWFVQDYAPNHPPLGLSAPLPRANRTVPGKAPRTNQLTLVLNRVAFHNPEEPEMFADVVLDFDIEGQRWRFPQKGARRVKHGAKVKLGRKFEISVPKDGALNLRVKLSPSVTTTDTPKFDAFEFFNLDNDRKAGAVQAVFTAADGWGKGDHAVRSSGEIGGYTLEFTIS